MACGSASSEQFAVLLHRILEGHLPLMFHFQPIADMQRGTVAGYEALVRFPKEMGPAPDFCFEGADRLGKRMALEALVTTQAIAARRFLPEDCFLSINLGPRFLLSPEWKNVLSSVTDLGGLVIEITEEESISDYDAVREAREQVRALGGLLAVDDAGSGYASLKHIVEIKPSFIKLDRMFVRNCHSDRAKSALIEMIGRAADRLDAWIIAEGVETQAELDELIRLGVPLGQGYFLGRPDPLMRELMPDKEEAIRSRVKTGGSRKDLRKHSDMCPARSTRDAAESLLSIEAGIDAVMVVDQWGRPIELVERRHDPMVHCQPELMKVQIATGAKEVLQRALARPLPCRFDPLALINNKGEFEGILRIDRLMRALLDS